MDVADPYPKALGGDLHHLGVEPLAHFGPTSREREMLLNIDQVVLNIDQVVLP